MTLRLPHIPEEKRSLIIIIVMLAALGPTLWLVQRSQELRRQAADSSVGEFLAPLETGFVNLSTNATGVTTASVKGGALKVTFAQGVLDSTANADKRLKLELLPTNSKENVLRFSVGIESSAIPSVTVTPTGGLSPTPTVSGPTPTPLGPTPTTSAAVTQNYSISATTNDAYDHTGGVCSTNAAKFGITGSTPMTAGFRFTGITKPSSGATIQSAYISWVADVATTGNVNVKIYGQKTPTTFTFDCTSNKPSQRTKTNYSVSYINTWVAGSTYTSGNLSAVLDEVVGQTGWNGTIALLVANNSSTGFAQPKDYFYYPNQAAKLVITWSGGTPAATSTPVPTVTPTRALTPTPTSGVASTPTPTGVPTVVPTATPTTVTAGTPTPTPTAVTYQIASAANDAYDRQFSCTTNSAKFGITSGDSHTAGFRFTGITRPASNATVQSATLRWVANTTDSSTPSVQIFGQKSAATLPFDCTSNKPSQRPKTSASTAVTYMPPAWTAGVYYDSGNLASVLNEVLTNAGGSWDGSFALLVANTGASGLRDPKVYDSAPSLAAKLIITWQTPVLGIASSALAAAGPDDIDFDLTKPVSDRNYTVEYNLSELQGKYSPSTFKFIRYKFDPNNQLWSEEEITPTITNGIARAQFSQSIQAGGKAEGASVFSPSLKSWETSLYTGAVTYSYPIDVLPGRGGLTPSLALTYNSNLANSLFDDQKGGLGGAGWDLTLPEVRFTSYGELHNCGERGNLDSFREGPQFSLILGGKEEPLVWIKNENNDEFGRFLTKSSNLEVKGYYGAYRGSSDYDWMTCASRRKVIYKWTVRDTSGTLYTFDANASSGMAAANRKVNDRMIPTRYMVTKIEDINPAPNTNIITFTYVVPSFAKDPGDSTHYFSVYPDRISYNGGRTYIIFSFGVKNNPASVGSGAGEKNIELGRLNQVQVFSDTNKLYRTYKFSYASWSDSNSKFDTLSKIEIFGPLGTETMRRFVPTEFGYGSFPVGLNSENTTHYFVGCSGETETHAFQIADLADLRDMLNGKENHFSEAQRQRLIAAGFTNCPGGVGCPTNAQVKTAGYAFTAYVGERVTPTPSGNYQMCLTKTDQGSYISWAKGTAPFLTLVKNGYGGEIVFAYQNTFNPEVGLNRNVVTSKEVFDRTATGTLPVREEFEYEPSPVNEAVRPNRGGGFGRVTLKDPRTAVKTTTFFYPLSPKEGDGGVDPESDPFYGMPLRSVVYKQKDASNYQIYSDQFTSYSVIPQSSPFITDTDLSAQAGILSWAGFLVKDNLLTHGFGKVVTTVSDSFTPKSASYIDNVPIDSAKPQFISSAKRIEFLRTQSRSWYDSYGYSVKSAQFGDVSGTFIADTDSRWNLNSGRERTKSWWEDADQFTFGTPMTSLLLGTAANNKTSTGSCSTFGGVLNNPLDCKDAQYYAVCCPGETRFYCSYNSEGRPANTYICKNPGSACRGSGEECVSYSGRTTMVTDPVVSGTPGSLKRFSYTKYDRSLSAINLLGLMGETFVSGVDRGFFDNFNSYPADKWGWSKNTYNSLGFLTQSTKQNTNSSGPSGDGVPSPNGPTDLTTTMVYDPYGNVKEQTDPKGNRVTTTYYTSGKPYDNILPSSTTQTASGVPAMTTTTLYDDTLWLPYEATDPNGVKSRTTYDCLGRVKEVFKPDPTTVGVVGGTASVSYLYYDYGAAGCGNGSTGSSPHLRTKARISSSTSDALYTYSDQISDGLGNPRQSMVLRTFVNGNYKALVSETKYDNRGLKEYETTPTEVGVINEANPPIFQTLSSPQKTFYTYDELGRVTLVKDPLSQYMRTDYAGLVTTVTDAKNLDTSGKVISKATQMKSLVDGFGRTVSTATTNLIETSGAEYGLATTQMYDVLDNVTSVVQKKCTLGACTVWGNTVLGTVTSSYDSLGRKWKMTDPDLGTWKYAYDANGNLTKQIDAKNQTLAFEYDGLNRLIKKTYPGNARGGLPTVRNFVRYVYDQDASDTGGSFTSTCTSGAVLKGKRVRMWDTTGNSYFCYDKRGRLTEEKKTVNKQILIGNTNAGTEEAITKYSYYESDALKSTTLPTGEVVNQTLNDVGQLIKVSGVVGTNTYNYLLGQQYNRFGSPEWGKLGNNLQATRRYDSIGRVSQICVAPWDKSCYDPLVAKLMDYQINPAVDVGRDKVGNIKSVTNSPAGYSLSFTYDRLYQLKTATGLPYPTAASYDYDVEGNITRKAEDSSVTMAYPTTFPRHAPKSMTVGTTTSPFTYDANGNLKQDDIRSYTWDFDNKPVSILTGTTNKITEFAYDGDGNRVLKRVISND